MNDFWEQSTRRDLKAMEQPGWEYPGDGAIHSRFKRKRSSNRGKKIAVRVLFAAAAAAVLGIGSVAAYEYWHMPKQDQPYSGELYDVHETQTYPMPSETSETVETEAKEDLSDAWFIQKAVEVLSAVNKLPVDADQLTLTRQKNQHWNREEVELSMDADNGSVTVSFDAEDGVLLHLTAFDEPYSGDESMTEAEALACAQGYYDSLPYARGYEYEALTCWDEDMWMFSFSKPYEIEGQTIRSDYEQVRITINPRNGHFQMSNCFYVPLLTEHDPDQSALTMEQARQIAESWAHFPESWRDYDCTASLTAVLPRPHSIPGEDEPATASENAYIVHAEPISGYVAYSVTRPGWVFRYDGEYILEGETEGFADGGMIAVDLYTGEILCLDFYG